MNPGLEGAKAVIEGFYFGLKPYILPLICTILITLIICIVIIKIFHRR